MCCKFGGKPTLNDPKNPSSLTYSKVEGFDVLQIWGSPVLKATMVLCRWTTLATSKVAVLQNPGSLHAVPEGLSSLT